MSASDHLLVIIDPVARRSDGESVRIAKDVLGARAVTKLCLPDNPVEFARALARRGARHLVVVGDDRALLRAVTLLHREREPESSALSLVPVGTAVSLAHSLGVPAGAVAAARAVLQGVVRRFDLLVDDGGGVVLGGVRIPPGGGGAGALPDGNGDAATGGAEDVAANGGGKRRHYQSLVRALAARRAAAADRAGRVPHRPRRVDDLVLPRSARLRVEADGAPLVDVDQPVDTVRVAPGTGGLARVEIRTAGRAPSVTARASRTGRTAPDAARTAAGAAPAPLHADARTVTVSGADFHYSADAMVAGPVQTRTWTVHAGAWGLTLPGGG